MNMSRCSRLEDKDDFISETESRKLGSGRANRKVPFKCV